MSRAPRRNYSSAFKAKIALEALKGEKTVPEVAVKHNIHHPLVNLEKQGLQDGASRIFAQASGEKEGAQQALVGELSKRIGQQKVEGAAACPCLIRNIDWADIRMCWG